jgi:hypothetical protein
MLDQHLVHALIGGKDPHRSRAKRRANPALTRVVSTRTHDSLPRGATIRKVRLTFVESGCGSAMPDPLLEDPHRRAFQGTKDPKGI